MSNKDRTFPDWVCSRCGYHAQGRTCFRCKTARYALVACSRCGGLYTAAWIGPNGEGTGPQWCGACALRREMDWNSDALGVLNWYIFGQVQQTLTRETDIPATAENAYLAMHKAGRRDVLGIVDVARRFAGTDALRP